MGMAKKGLITTSDLERMRVRGGKSGLPNLNIPPHEVRGRIEDAVPDMPAVPAMPAPAPPPAPPLPPAPRIPGL